jgi:ABC-2 type transport system permease protein
MNLVLVQLRTELRILLRNGEQLLLILGIPVFLLVFFGSVDVLPTGDGAPIDFLVPGIIAVAVMSTSMVSLGISTGFQRSYGVFTRLGLTPLGTSRLIVAKSLAIAIVEVLQIALIFVVGVAMGWRADASGLAAVVAGVVGGTLAFSGIGLFLAGRLRAEVNLATQNGLYLVLLLTSGMIIDTDSMPSIVDSTSKWLPARSLADVIRFHARGDVAEAQAWLTLLVWAVVAPLVAARAFRWSETD